MRLTPSSKLNLFFMVSSLFLTSILAHTLKDVTRKEALKLTGWLSHTQQAEAVFDKISGTINITYPGLISMLQGFLKCIA